MSRNVKNFTVEGTALTSASAFVTLNDANGNIFKTDSLVGLINGVLVNSGTGTMTDFKMQIQEHPGGAWFDYLSGTQWGVTNSSLLYIGSANPAYLGSGGAQTNFHLSVGCPNGVRFQGKGVTTVSLYCKGVEY